MVIPAKRLLEAKSRLTNRDLASAFLEDVLTATQQCHQVSHIFLVTSDPELSSLGASFSAEILPDPGSGLSPAIKIGIDACDDKKPLAVVLGDLPCLTVADLDLFFSYAATLGCCFLSDAEGTGSTIWARLPGNKSEPHFGTRSRAAHVQSGSTEISDPNLFRARRDVDTDITLWDAQRMGIGIATRKKLNHAVAATRTDENSEVLATVTSENPLLFVTESGCVLTPSLEFNSIYHLRRGQRLVCIVSETDRKTCLSAKIM